jgi:hypothetical protein
MGATSDVRSAHCAAVVTTLGEKKAKRQAKLLRFVCFGVFSKNAFEWYTQPRERRDKAL